MRKVLENFDFFKAPVPSFTINSKKSLGTSIGFIMSIMMAVVLLAFTVSKGIIVIQKSNSIITTLTKEHEVSEIDVSKMGFELAFRVTSGKKGGWKSLHDPDFVEFAPFISVKVTSKDQ